MPTSKRILNLAIAKLESKQMDPNLAYLLFDDIFNISKVTLMTDPTHRLSDEELAVYTHKLDEVLTGKPYQYVVGVQHFYGRRFIVNEHVLIPRNETEELVELILEREKEPITVVDIGTGSGVIAVTLALHTDHTVMMSDIDIHALAVAKQNNERHRANAKPFHGDLYEPFQRRNIMVDCIVSNPPYIAADETHLMAAETLNYEPHIALFAEDAGLSIYKRMIKDLPLLLKPGGRVYFEIGFRQAARITDYIQSLYPNVSPQVAKDINGHDRILYFTWDCE